MKKKLFILVCIVGLAGCYKDTEEELYPDWSTPPPAGGCDTTDVSFATTIKPILDQYCATAGCHTTANAPSAGGYDLSNYAGVSLAKGRIVGAVKWLPDYKAMPQGGNKLNDCQVSQINAWVTEGAKNN